MTKQILKNTVWVAASAAIMMSFGADRAHAGLDDFVKGVEIICRLDPNNCRGSNRVRDPKPPKPPVVDYEQIERNKEVQNALNAFNFPVGRADGILGTKSRDAIRDYQGYMNYQRTGQLKPWQRENLVNGWRKYLAGAGQRYPNMMAALGPRSLLKTEEDPRFPEKNGYGTAWNNGSRNDDDERILTDEDGDGVTVEPPTDLDNLLKTNEQSVASVTTRCENVSLFSAANGAILASNMTDPNQALSEKFCDARSYAITNGQNVASGYAISENELTKVCNDIKDAYQTTLPSLAKGEPNHVAAQIRAASATLGLTNPSTTAAFGQICMGIGYRKDDAGMALSGALANISVGQAPYGEIVGHHLREGFGTQENPKASVVWYDMAMDALEEGAEPAFEPSSTLERVSVIRAAISKGLRADLGGQQKLVPVANKLPALFPDNN